MTRGLEKIKMLEQGRWENSQRKQDHVLQQLFWECTLRCNLHCRHCGSDCQLSDVRKDMPLRDFLASLDDIIQKMNLQHLFVITTGGEPLVRSDIEDCGRAIRQRGFYWGMVTNGMLLNEQRLDGLLKAGLNAVSVSLDGFEEEHNWMRGHELSFSRAVSAIKLIADNSDRLGWDVITCVNKHNISSLLQFREYLQNIGVKNWRLITVFPSGRAAQNADLQLDAHQLRSLLDFIAETRQVGNICASYGCEGFLGPYEHEVRNYQYFCQAGVNVASILHDGSISGCLSIRSEYNQGNIYRDSFSDVWENRFQKYRNRSWMKTGVCEKCEVWRWCEGNGMHLRDDDGKLLLCSYDKMYHSYTRDTV